MLSNCAILHDLFWVLDEVTVVGEVGPGMKAGVCCYSRGRSSHWNLRTFGAAAVQRWLHTVVDSQSYDTMESQRSWSTMLSTIFSFYNSYPHFFSHALNDRRSGHFTPESPKTRIKPEHCSAQHLFWVYHKRNGCLFTLYTSSFCLVGSSFFRNVLCDCNIDKKRNKNSQHLSPLPN